MLDITTECIVNRNRARIEILEALINNRERFNRVNNERISSLRYKDFSQCSTTALFEILLEIKSVTSVKEYALNMFKIFLEEGVDITDLMKSKRESGAK